MLLCFAAPLLQADTIWNFNFSGTDGYNDTLTITGTISTAPAPPQDNYLTIDAVDLTYNQTGFPGAPNEPTIDTSTTITTFYNADDVLSPTPPYLDGDGLSFLLEGLSGGTDYSGNVNISNDDDVTYCVPIEDDPSFCGNLTVSTAAVPEPASVGLTALGLFAAALRWRRTRN
jgi:hypothetical protein